MHVEFVWNRSSLLKMAAPWTNLTYRIFVLTSTAACCIPTWAQDSPFTHAEFAAILSSLGFQAQPSGLTTVRLFLSGDGGHLDLPPQIAGDLCLTERHYFHGDAETGYSASGEPALLYWRPVSTNGCNVETLADISDEKTSVAESVPRDQLSVVITRTDELVQLARESPRCEEAPRFFEIFEEPLYISTLEQREPSTDELVATLATVGVHAGPEVAFSLVEDEFVVRRVCTAFWSPFAYEDEIRTFRLP